jgi:uncharacterized protein
MVEDRREWARRFHHLDNAFKCGDLDAIRSGLGDPKNFPNCALPLELGIGDSLLNYAIAWSPLALIETLLVMGADANAPAGAGFPSLMTALSTRRTARFDVLKLLLAHGASVQQRGINDWTPLHYAVALRDIEAVGLLLRHGAEPDARTNVDDYSTPIEDARTIGFSEAATMLEKARRP